MEHSDQEKKNERNADESGLYRKMTIHGWAIIIAIAVIFVLYGLFSYFYIGYREPPDWDFGQIEDVPGQSAYST